MTAMLVVGVYQSWALLQVGRRSVTLRRMADFGVFYRSAQRVKSGQNPYEVTTPIVTEGRILAPNLNPPHAILLMAPFAFLAQPLALAAWLLASGCSALIALRIVFKEIGIGTSPPTVVTAAFLLSSAAATGAFLMSFQISWLLWAPVTWAWMLARHRRWTSAAVVLGITASVKPFLGLFVPFLLWRRQWVAALIATVVAICCFLAGIAALGWHAFVNWIQAIGSVEWMEHIFNASVFGYFTRLLTDHSTDRAWVLTPLTQAPRLGLLLGFVGALVIFAISLWSLRLPRPAADEHSVLEVDRLFAVTLLASLLMTPLGWIYYQFVAVAPTVALIMNRQWRMSVASRSALLALGAVCLTLSPRVVASGQPSAWATASIGSAYFWGTLAFWCCAIARVTTASDTNRNRYRRAL